MKGGHTDSLFQGEEHANPELLKTLEIEHRGGLRLASLLRIIILLFIGLWFYYGHGAPPTSSLNHTLILTGLVAPGLLFFVLLGSRRYAEWQAYLLAALDAGFMTAAIFYPFCCISTPEDAPQSAYVFYFVLLGFTVLTYNPYLVVWSAVVNVLSWLTGFTLYLSWHGLDDWEMVRYTNALFEQASVMFILGATLSVAVWRSRHLILRRVHSGRHYHVVLGLERDGRSEAERLARTDNVTGLGNRTAFLEDLSAGRRALSSGELHELFIIMLDIDGMKLVNDSQGHDRGDELLRRFSMALRHYFPEGTSHYRYGGDEFLLLYPLIAPRESPDFNLTRQSVIQAIHRAGFPQAGVSLGISSLRETHLDMDRAIKLADQRMYQQKQLNKQIIINY